MTPTAGDILFVDTNVLLTATDDSRPRHRDAIRLFNEAEAQGVHLAVSGQIFREYLVVATRSWDANGLGLDVRDAVANVNEFLRRTHAYGETEEVARRLRQLALTYSLSGKVLHDANIVATMTVNGISVLVTQNLADFARFKEIEAVGLENVSLGQNTSD